MGMMKSTLAILSLAAIILFGIGGTAYADPVELTATHRGSYLDSGVFGTGGSGTSLGNYLTGIHNNKEYRSFFSKLFGKR